MKFNELFTDQKIAEMLKEKGYDESTEIRYTYPATPTWHQLDEWLLNKGILIETFPVDNWDEWHFRISVRDQSMPFLEVKNSAIENSKEVTFETKMEAYKAAVEYVLDKVL